MSSKKEEIILESLSERRGAPGAGSGGGSRKKSSAEGSMVSRNQSAECLAARKQLGRGTYTQRADEYRRAATNPLWDVEQQA